MHINGLTASAAQLLTTVRPDLRTDVAKLGSLAKSLDAGSDTITYTLHRLPRVYQVLARLGAYGNFFNFYLCQTQERLTLPERHDLPHQAVEEPGGEVQVMKIRLLHKSFAERNSVVIGIIGSAVLVLVAAASR